MVVPTVEQCATYGTARYLFLGASDILDSRVLAACAGFGGKVRAGRAYIGFMACVGRFRMATIGRRPMAGIGALDDSATRSGISFCSNV